MRASATRLRHGLRSDKRVRRAITMLAIAQGGGFEGSIAFIPKSVSSNPRAPEADHHRSDFRGVLQYGVSNLVDEPKPPRKNIMSRCPYVRSRLGGPSSAGSKISAQIKVQISEIIRISPILAVPG